MAMKVNYSALEGYSTKIESGLKDLTTALEKAKTAGESAVAAGGGARTGVGSAIQRSIADFPVSQHESAVKVINDLLAALLGVSRTYRQADEDLVNQIKAIKARADALVASQNGTRGGSVSTGLGGGPSHITTISMM